MEDHELVCVRHKYVRHAYIPRLNLSLRYHISFITKGKNDKGQVRSSVSKQRVNCVHKSCEISYCQY